MPVKRRALSSTACQGLDETKEGFILSSHMRDKAHRFAPTDSTDLITLDGEETDEILEGCCGRVTRAQSFDGSLSRAASLPPNSAAICRCSPERRRASLS